MCVCVERKKVGMTETKQGKGNLNSESFVTCFPFIFDKHVLGFRTWVKFLPAQRSYVRGRCLGMDELS